MLSISGVSAMLLLNTIFFANECATSCKASSRHSTVRDTILWGQPGRLEGVLIIKQLIW